MQKLSPQLEAALWRRLAREPDCVGARNALVEHYLPLVDLTLAKMRGRMPLEWQRARSDGRLGLIGAVGRFDPGRGNKFATFAAYRIRGAILDGARQLDDVGRLTRLKINRQAVKRERLAHERGPVNDEELDESLRAAGESEVIVAAPATVHRDALPTDDESDRETYDATGQIPQQRPTRSSADAQRFFARITKGLEFEEQLILYLHAVRAIPMTRIGEILGCGESCISLRYGKLIDRLRQQLDRDDVLEVLAGRGRV